MLLSLFAVGAPRASLTLPSFKCLFKYIQNKQVATAGIKTAMEEHGVVPDVISAVPPQEIQVTYPSGVKAKQGNILAPRQVKDEPSISFTTSPGALYTLSMSDPDAPSRIDPKFRQWQHWLVVNIPGSDVGKGQVINEYVGAGPPPDTGLHRYVFLVYQQKGKLTPDETTSSRKSGNLRPKFNISDFAAKYNLGHPIAGNFFQAQWDDYVPTLYKQLTD